MQQEIVRKAHNPFDRNLNEKEFVISRTMAVDASVQRMARANV